MKKPKRKFYPPVNFKATVIYLTPEQHDKIKRLAEEETRMLVAKRQAEGHMIVKPGAMRVSVSDYIRAMIEREPEPREESR